MGYRSMFEDALREAGASLSGAMTGTRPAVEINFSVNPYYHRCLVEVTGSGVYRSENVCPSIDSPLPLNGPARTRLMKDVQVKINELKEEYELNGYEVNAYGPYKPGPK